MEDNQIPVNTQNEAEQESQFTNQQIDSTTLPKIEEIQFQSIPRTAMYVNMIVLGIMSLIAIACLIVLFIFYEKSRAYIIPISCFIVAILSILFTAEIKGYKFMGYAVREHDIMYRHGWLWKSQIVVPFNRIQHMEVDQGPIDRLFDLANLILYTAGGTEIEVEGLSPDQAHSIKSYIMNKTQEIKNPTLDDESE